MALCRCIGTTTIHARLQNALYFKSHVHTFHMYTLCITDSTLYTPSHLPKRHIHQIQSILYKLSIYVAFVSFKIYKKPNIQKTKQRIYTTKLTQEKKIVYKKFSFLYACALGFLYVVCSLCE